MNGAWRKRLLGLFCIALIFLLSLDHWSICGLWVLGPILTTLQVASNFHSFLPPHTAATCWCLHKVLVYQRHRYNRHLYLNEPHVRFQTFQRDGIWKYVLFLLTLRQEYLSVLVKINQICTPFMAYAVNEGCLNIQNFQIANPLKESNSLRSEWYETKWSSFQVSSSFRIIDMKFE